MIKMATFVMNNDMKMHAKRSLLMVVLTLLFVSALFAQPAQTLIDVNVAPDRNNWVYKPKDKVKFNVTVTKSNVPVKDVSVRYEVGPEMMPPVTKGNLTLKNGSATIDGGTLKEAGFLRCRVIVTYEGKSMSDWLTAASIRSRFARQPPSRRISCASGTMRKLPMIRYRWMLK